MKTVLLGTEVYMVFSLDSRPDPDGWEMLRGIVQGHASSGERADVLFDRKGRRSCSVSRLGLTPEEAYRARRFCSSIWDSDAATLDIWWNQVNAVLIPAEDDAMEVSE